MKKSFVLLMALTLILTFAFGVSAKEVLTVGSDVAYPPFEYADEATGEYLGFDMELIKAIGEEMGVEVKIINTAWDGIIPGLINGNYDCIISAMTITEERAQAVNFSDPYFKAAQAVVVKKDYNKIDEWSDLAGKVAAVQLGTTGDFAATDVKGIKKVSRFKTSPEAILEVLNGAADCAVVDDGVAAFFEVENPGLIKVAAKKITGEEYGIAIAKKNTELLARINKALAALKANGTYDKIYDKWF